MHLTSGLVLNVSNTRTGPSDCTLKIIHYRRSGSRKGVVRFTRTATEQVTIIIFPKLVAEEVKSKGVNARVDERQTEAGYFEDVPELVKFAVVKIVA